MTIESALAAHQLHVTTREYHAHPALSCSRLLSAGLYTETEEFWTPHEYATPKSYGADAMNVGTLVHAGYYEPERFPEMYAVRPVRDDGVAVACSTRAYGEWALANEGRIHVLPKHVEPILGMVAALHTADDSGCLREYRSLTRRVSVEANYVVRCPKTMMDLRIKPDELRVHAVRDTLYCDDLKTTTDVSPVEFRRSCGKYNYWRRAAWYRSVLRLITGVDCTFRMVVVQSDAPHLVAMYQVPTARLDDAERQNDESLAALARCIETGDFRPAWLKGAYEI